MVALLLEASFGDQQPEPTAMSPDPRLGTLVAFTWTHSLTLALMYEIFALWLGHPRTSDFWYHGVGKIFNFSSHIIGN